MLQQNVDTSRQLLTQLVSSVDREKTNIESLLFTISGDARTASVTHRREPAKEEVYYLFLMLSEWKGFYSDIENVSVLNTDTQVCVQAKGDRSVSEASFEAVSTMLQNQTTMLCRDVILFNKEKNVISFMQYLPYQNSAILIDVNSELFQYSMNEESEDRRMVYILDEKGNPVTKAARGTVRDLPVAEYLSEIIFREDTPKNMMVYNDKRNRQIVFFCKSQSTGWWFCDIQSYGLFYKEFEKAGIIFGILLFVFFVASIITTFVFLQKFQKPLLNIVRKYRDTSGMDEPFDQDELAYLDQAIEKISREKFIYDKYVSAQYLKNLLRGQSMPLTLPKERLRALSNVYEAAYYAVIFIKIQNVENLSEEKRKEEYSLLRFVVCNLSDEIFGEKYRCNSVDLGEDEIGILLMLEEEKLSDSYIECYSKMKEFAMESFKITLSGSVGSVVKGMENIRKSCEKAEQYGKVTNLIGKNELIDSNQISHTNYQEKNQKLVEAIIEYTEMNYPNPDLSLKSISQLFHLSTSYVGKIFKSIQGKSYSAYLTEYRLEEAKVLLTESGKSVNEIAGSLGFANTTYFATVFKNQYGMTPTAFRTESNIQKTTQK